MSFTNYAVGSIYSLPTEICTAKDGWRNRFKGHGQVPIEDKVRDIKQNGQLTPALAYQRQDGRVILLDGHGRKEACERLGKPLMVRFVKEPSTPQEEALIRHGANVVLHMSTMDKAVQMECMYNAGVKQDVIAKQFCNAQGKPITRNYVSMCLNLLKLVGPAQELIHRGVKGCGVAWGIELGKRPTAEQLLECERASQGETDVLGWVKEEMDSAGIQTPAQSEAEDDKEREDGEIDAPVKGDENPDPKKEAIAQRTLSHVKELLKALSESPKTKDREVPVGIVCDILLAFANDRNATMEDTRTALASDRGTTSALKDIADAKEKAAKEAAGTKAAKEAADKAAKDKANADRIAFVTKCCSALKEAGWIPMAFKEGTEPTKWKDPTNPKAGYVDTLMAHGIMVDRKVASKA